MTTFNVFIQYIISIPIIYWLLLKCRRNILIPVIKQFYSTGYTKNVLSFEHIKIFKQYATFFEIVIKDFF